jgi:predicted anti-sigma-YlaC factor YlaD
MYSCERYREALSARLDGEDPGISEDAIESHLVSCSDCRAWVDAGSGLSTYEVAVDGPALDPAALIELLDEGPRPSRDRGPIAWQVALTLMAALQLMVTWFGLLADDGPAPAHAARELASWDLSLAVGFLSSPGGRGGPGERCRSWR